MPVLELMENKQIKKLQAKGPRQEAAKYGLKFVLKVSKTTSWVIKL